MKPIQLTIQAFGSYGQRTVIDFTKPAQNLFLITGDTGAGKTTIFDAMVYALYGDKSEKNTNKNVVIPNLQSQFASLDTTPFVELAFSKRMGGQAKKYVVRRVPNHKRKAKRGKKEVEEKESVILTMPDHTDYPGNKDAINEKIREIVGLAKEQFMQVGMIAQGDFMRILRAPTAEKREIFRRLFNTEIFDRIVSRLGERNSQQQKELNKILILCQSKADDVIVPDDFEERESLAELLFKLRKDKLPSIVDLERLETYLQKICDRLDAAEKQAAAETASAQQLYDADNVALTQGRLLKKAFDQLAEAESKLQSYQEKTEKMQAKERQAKEIQAAYAIRAAYQAFVQQQDIVEKNEKEQKKQEEALPSLQLAVEQATKAARQAKLALDAELAEFGRVQAEIKASLDLFADSEAKEKIMQQAAQKERLAGIAAEQKKQAYAAYQKQAAIWKEQAEELPELQGKLAEERQKEQKLAAYYEEIKQGILRGQVMQQAKKEADEAQEKYLAMQERYQQQREEYESANMIFLNAQAGILAASLQEGKPCPVCGSLEHPKPHALTGEQKPLAREAIDAMARQVAKLSEDLSKTSADAGTAKSQYHAAKENFEELLEKLRAEVPGCQNAETLNEMNQAVRRLMTDCTDILRDLSEQIVKREQSKQQLDAAAEKMETMQSAVEIAEKAWQDAVRVHTAAQEAVRVLRGKLRYATREDAVLAGKAAETAKAVREKTYQEKEKVLQEAQSALSQAKTIRDKCRRELPAMQCAVAELSATYQSIMEIKTMPAERWQRIAAAYTEDCTDALLQEVQTWKNAYHAAKGSAETAKANIDGRAMPNLAILTRQLEQAQEACRQAAEHQAMIRGQVACNRRVLAQLSLQLDSRKTMIKEAVCISNLYERLSGKRSGARMDIETYVQRYYLQQILGAANRRFCAMSGGQFELRMLSEEEAGRGGNHGLDLKVYHTVTGKERAIQTLSGGESFMAALSLALGMSDQIQANKAAMKLDVLFIDEGFGSLDDNSRNEAVRVLSRMAGGSKLIGIISHVSELKQAIDSQLVVQKDERGSHADWQIS